MTYSELVQANRAIRTAYPTVGNRVIRQLQWLRFHNYISNCTVEKYREAAVQIAADYLAKGKVKCTVSQ